MARKNDITVCGYMILEDRSVVRMEDLSAEQLRRFRDASASRLSRAMSAYYAQRPEEFDRLTSSQTKSTQGLLGKQKGE